MGEAIASVEVDLGGVGSVANVMLRFGTFEGFFFGEGSVWDCGGISIFVVVALECDRAEIGATGEVSSTDVPVSSLPIGWVKRNRKKTKG